MTLSNLIVAHRAIKDGFGPLGSSTGSKPVGSSFGLSLCVPREIKTLAAPAALFLSPAEAFLSVRRQMVFGASRKKERNPAPRGWACFQPWFSLQQVKKEALPLESFRVIFPEKPFCKPRKTVYNGYQ